MVTRSLNPFAVANKNLIRDEVDIFDSQVGAFPKAKASAVKESCHQTGRALHGGEKLLDLLLVQDGGQTRWTLCSKFHGRDLPLRRASKSEESAVNHGFSNLRQGLAG